MNKHIKGLSFLMKLVKCNGKCKRNCCMFFEERQIQRVGGTANIPVDIRVLTATNQDLEAAVEAGTFRNRSVLSDRRVPNRGAPT